MEAEVRHKLDRSGAEEALIPVVDDSLDLGDALAELWLGQRDAVLLGRARVGTDLGQYVVDEGLPVLGCDIPGGIELAIGVE